MSIFQGIIITIHIVVLIYIIVDVIRFNQRMSRDIEETRAWRQKSLESLERAAKSYFEQAKEDKK